MQKGDPRIGAASSYCHLNAIMTCFSLSAANYALSIMR